MSAVMQDLTPIIRPMREHDLMRIHAIEQSAYQFPWSIGVFGECLRAGYSCWIIAHEEVTVGYAIMSVAVQESHILNLCVDPSYHRNGFAQELLKHMLKTAESYDAVISYLEVRPSNLAAIRLYENAGYSQVGVRSDYYPALDGREDAYVMSKQLDGKSIA